MGPFDLIRNYCCGGNNDDGWLRLMSPSSGCRKQFHSNLYHAHYYFQRGRWAIEEDCLSAFPWRLVDVDDPPGEARLSVRL
jgi:hypothetical protein